MSNQKPKNWMQRAFGLINHDFCPSINPYIYWLKRPIGWVVCAIVASLFAGIFIGSQGYILACVFAALLIFGLIWPFLSLKGVQVTLEFPQGRYWAEDEMVFVLKVRNYWPLPVFGLIIDGDFLQNENPDDDRVTFSLRKAPALSETEFEIPVTPRRRGLLPTGIVKIKNGFPFGLHDFCKEIEYDSSSLVWPACAPIDEKLLNDLAVKPGFDKPVDKSGNDGETIGVRPFQQGDKIKNIHWAQTVRSQGLMVRERQVFTTESASLLLDLTPSHHAGDVAHNSYEWAIRFAASICYQLHQSRSNVRVFCFGLDQEFCSEEGNENGIQKLLDFFTLLPTHDHSQGSHVERSLPVPAKAKGQLITVGTDKSVFELGKAVDNKSVCIQLDRFLQSEKPVDQVSQESLLSEAVNVTGLASRARNSKRALSWGLGRASC